MTTVAHLELTLDGQTLRVQVGTSLAAALAMRGQGCARTSVTGEARAPLCGMGVCQECRVLVDGRRCLACQTLCQDGMAVDTGTRAG
jgi:aerobic-type carbon monoxide dehydrogenase small subunit (CoxS/CutS family)